MLMCAINHQRILYCAVFWSSTNLRESYKIPAIFPKNKTPANLTSKVAELQGGPSVGNPRRTRKRVRANAIRRAPDGSAFQKCNSCGASVPIALAGMHECELNENVKRFRGVSVDVKKQSIWDQLVIMAPFHFFLKESTKTNKAGNWVAINREGFEAWKNMSDNERQPYVAEAEKIDKAYQKALLEEANYKFKVDDEADSAAVGNNGKPGEFSEDYENSDGSSDVFWDNSATTGSWHTYHRPMVHEFTSWNWKWKQPIDQTKKVIQSDSSG